MVFNIKVHKHDNYIQLVWQCDLNFITGTVLLGHSAAYVFDNKIAVTIGHEASARVGEITLDRKHARPILKFRKLLYNYSFKKDARSVDKTFQCN